METPFAQLTSRQSWYKVTGPFGERYYAVDATSTAMLSLLDMTAYDVATVKGFGVRLVVEDETGKLMEATTWEFFETKEDAQARVDELIAEIKEAEEDAKDSANALDRRQGGE